MCGISGVVSGNDIVDPLFRGIRQLEYRGYDSCGMALLYKGELITAKNTGSIDEVNKKENFYQYSATVGIAHTRWATHGGVSAENTHPHVSSCGRFALVHNGIITNYRELKAQLQEKGYTFFSETDSEVIVHLIEDFYKQNESIEESLILTSRVLSGSYAVCLVSSLQPDTIFCMRHESPLVLGIGEGANYVASDFYAFLTYTKNTILLEDHELAVVSKDSYLIKNMLSGEVCRKKITHLDWSAETAQKGGYPHYMLKEIYEQPDALRKALSTSSEELSNFVTTLTEARSKYFTGVGTTFYVAEYAKYFFSAYAGEFIPAISSDEFTSIVPAHRESAVLSFSQSGETYDTLQAIRAVNGAGGKTLAVTNVIGSTMSRVSDFSILQKSGPEICVISTKAALCQMMIASLLGLEYGFKKGTITKEEYEASLQELQELPDMVEKMLNEQSGFIHKVAQSSSKQFNWLFLGKGMYYAIAQESALKLKEVAYVHAEGMPCGFLKHGTIALIEPGFASMVFVPHHEEKHLFQHTLSSIEEIKARNGKVIAFHFGTNVPSSLLDAEMQLPSEATKIQAPFLQMVAAQLFSYYVARTLKRAIDKPRNLAKSVTVG